VDHARGGEASNALRRLRNDFDDALLVRSGRTLTRTPLAEQLRGPTRDVLAAAGRLFEVGAPFEPGGHDGEFIVTTSDRVAEIVLPALDRLLVERAPRASLSIRTTTVEAAPFLRDHGGVAITPGTGRERGLSSEKLFRYDFVCVLREGHPLLTGPWTARRLAAAEHLLVAPQAQSRRGPVDEVLESWGLSRRITRVVTSFALAAPLLISSERIAILPRSFTLTRARELGLRVRAPPFELPSIEMEMSWHPMYEKEPKRA
jgi:DNA-binding transcriptional LysR family regulator